MSILPNFLRSLVLTTLLSFVAPIVVVIALLATLSIIGFVPGLEAIGQTGTAQLLNFLAVFGTGSPLQGVTIIGLACSFVGALFDAYIFYRYQTLNDIN
ncbi:MAG: hypothetical protein LDL41_15245 [Coleofasciculus sp. S288]|nr:hypothetical protein [Coleofasciculus sp. S288]